MSFLGLGVTAPTAEWGVMINDARQYIWTQPLQMFWPGLALFISVMALTAGDVLRDHLTSSGDGARTLMPQQIELRNIATGRAAAGARRIVNPATGVCWR